MMVEVNNKEVKEYSRQLRKMHRSNFPLAVRGTLNDMAFDVKKTTLLKSADKEFILRNPSFFKRNSGIEKATGFNVQSMRSEVGMLAGRGKAVDQLTEQEFGGTLKRPAIYMDTARAGKNKSRRVRKANYLNKGSITGSPNRKRSDKSQFVANAIIAKQENKFLLQDGTLFNVHDVKFGKGKNRKVFVRMSPVASYEENRNVRIKATGFLQNASMMTYSKAREIFIRNAKKRFERGRK